MSKACANCLIPNKTLTLQDRLCMQDSGKWFETLIAFDGFIDVETLHS